MDTGRAIQSVDFETGIVGENKQVARIDALLFRQPLSQFGGFLASVAFEGGGVFDDFRCFWKIAQCQVMMIRSENLAYLVDFVCVASSNEDFHEALI